MSRWLAGLTATITLALAAPGSTEPANDPLLPVVNRDLRFAAHQLGRTLREVPLTAYPQETRPDGRWSTSGPGRWTSGFLAGSLWLMYQATGDPAWSRAAGARQAGPAGERANPSPPHPGLLILENFGQGVPPTRA